MKSTNLELLQRRNDDPMTSNFVGYLREREADIKEELVMAKGDVRDELQGAVKEIKFIIAEITRKPNEIKFHSGAYNP